MIEMTVVGSIWASSVAFISTVATSWFRSSGRTRRRPEAQPQWLRFCVVCVPNVSHWPL